MGRRRWQGTRQERLGDDRSTRVLALALVVLASLAVGFPTGVTAATARDITSQSKIVAESFAVSLPNDPNRCVVSFFVEFPDVRGATSYTALILNSGFNPPRQQTFGATPPNFPDDEYTVSVGGQTKTVSAPSGSHRIFLAGFSSGSGCAGEPWVSVVQVTAGGVSDNEPPDASFTWEARDGEPLTVDVDGSASTDDDAIQTYAWDFGDGGAGSGVTSSHAFAAEGTHDVTLTVTDTDGETDSQTQQIAVSVEGGGGGESESPVAAFTATASQVDPYTIFHDGSGSTDDGRIVSYDWDFGDGATGAGVTTSHTFPGHGTYDVSLAVTDDDGLEDDLTQPVIANAPPEARIDWQPSAIDRLSIGVDASGSTDDSEIVDYAWDFGDRTAGSGSTATHEYASPGSYTVTLVVTDEDGAQTTTSVAAFVTGEGAYRLELPEVYGEEADLLLDEDGQVVAIECSLGSVLGKGMNVMSAMFGDDFDPACLTGAIGVALDSAVGDSAKMLETFSEAFSGGKLFPESTSGKSLSQMLNAFGVENLSESLGSIQARVDKVALPPAQDGVTSVTPDKKTSKSIAGLLTTFADGFQRTNQGLFGIRAVVEGLKELTPQTP